MTFSVNDPRFTSRLISLLVDEPTSFVYVIDMQAQRFVYASRSCSRLLGLKPDELCAPDAPTVGEFLVEPEGDQPGDLTMGRMLSLRHADGSRRWLQAREIVLEQNDKGEVLLLLGLGRDVTRGREVVSDLGMHKYLLRTLNRIVEKFSTLAADADLTETIESSLETIGPLVGASRCHLCQVIDRGRMPIKLSITHEWYAADLTPAKPGFEHVPVNLFPWFFEQVDKGRPVYLASRGQLPESDRILSALLAARGASSYLVLPVTDGDVTWGFLGLVPADTQSKLWDDDVMALLRLLGQIFVNRLKYADANRQLTTSELKWRQTADAAYDLVLLLDAESKVVEASTKRHDLDESGYVGVDVFSLVNPGSYRKLRNAISRALVARTVDEGARGIELQAAGPGGKLTWYRARISPRIEGEVASGVNVFASIIQGQKEAAERIAELNKELEHASRLSVLGQMATEIAHELNQPLQVISSYAEGLQLRLARLGEHHDLTRVTDQIVSAADDAADTVRNIREFVQHRVVEPRVTPVDEIVQASLALAEPVIREHDAVVRTDVPDGLPDVLVNAAQINHVLLNLIINGIEAAVGDVMLEQIEIEVSCQVDEDSERIRFTVSDNGPGVPRDKRDAIFTRYVTTKKSGLGVGLASSRDVVERYGGELELVDLPTTRRGAVFEFTLPTAGDEVDDDDDEDDDAGL